MISRLSMYRRIRGGGGASSSWYHRRHDRSLTNTLPFSSSSKATTMTTRLVDRPHQPQHFQRDATKLGVHGRRTTSIQPSLPLQNHRVAVPSNSSWTTMKPQVRSLASSLTEYEEDDNLYPTEDSSSSSSSSTSSSLTKTIEERYSKKTPLEHVLLRPGMYIGPVERLPPNDCWVLDPTPPVPGTSEVSPLVVLSQLSTPTEDITQLKKPSFRMVHKEYGLIPALIKVFDEILVNASDNRLRNPTSSSRIDVMIDPGSAHHDPCIQVKNDGKGIPIQVCVDVLYYEREREWCRV
jgi:hypothetical protein